MQIQAIFQTLIAAMREVWPTVKGPPLPSSVTSAPWPPAPTDLVGAIGLAGKITGQVLVAADKRGALSVASGMLDERYTDINEDVASVIAEIVNIVSGRFKLRIDAVGNAFEVSTPMVTLPPSSVRIGRQVSVVGARFTTGAGTFSLYLACEKCG